MSGEDDFKRLRHRVSFGMDVEGDGGMRRRDEEGDGGMREDGRDGGMKGVWYSTRDNIFHPNITHTHVHTPSWYREVFVSMVMSILCVSRSSYIL